MPPVKNNFYAYFLSNDKKGIVNSWAECEKIVKGKTDARYRGFKTKPEAEEWLKAGAKYEIKIKKKLPKGICFDAGTGRGEGVEISVTDENGKDVLDMVIHSGLINRHGKHLLSKGKTNNYGELLACSYALEVARKTKSKSVFGDSRLVIDYWSKGFIKKDVDKETISLAREVSKARDYFESKGGKIILISGDDNPADLGFHK